MNFINSKEKRKEKETISDEFCQINDNVSSENPDDHYELIELIDKVQPLFNKLPDELKKLIELYEIYDYSYDDISKELSIPVGTVRSRIFRARQYLMESLKERL